jgi:hypothetical protein
MLPGPGFIAPALAAWLAKELFAGRAGMATPAGQRAAFS